MTRQRTSLAVLVAASVWASVSAAGQGRPGDQPVFSVGSARASRGQTATGAIDVPAGSDAALSLRQAARARSNRTTWTRL
jgi:hypothetical protein